MPYINLVGNKSLTRLVSTENGVKNTKRAPFLRRIDSYFMTFPKRFFLSFDIFRAVKDECKDGD